MLRWRHVAIPQRPTGVRGGGPAHELHPGGGRAERHPDCDQPPDPPAGGATTVPLFVRRNRALELTREAEDYLPAVRSAFEDLRRATDRLRRPDTEGLLTVSTTASLAAKWLVTRVAAFQDANPGIEVRITTSTHLVDFQREEVDMAVRYGRGTWPGLRADWLMAEDIFPVCSPALAKPLRRPEDLATQTMLHATALREDWQLWLTAAGLPASIARQRGLVSTRAFMAIQAAMDGLGVALGRRASGGGGHRRRAAGGAVRHGDAGRCRLLRGGARRVAETPKIARFRDWLVASAAPDAVVATGLSRKRLYADVEADARQTRKWFCIFIGVFSWRHRFLICVSEFRLRFLSHSAAGHGRTFAKEGVYVAQCFGGSGPLYSFYG